MKKILRFTAFTALLLLLFFLGTLLADKYALRNNVIRLHVLANSDSNADQSIKMAVKDAVVAYILVDMPNPKNIYEAKALLSERLCDIQSIANEVLDAKGSSDRAIVTLCKETYGIRDYETFSLPSGVYESLRVEIGEAKGKNWWCVVFPSLCVPTTCDEFVEAAVSSGLDPMLADTLAENDTFEVRFYLLDFIGKIEKFFSFS